MLLAIDVGNTHTVLGLFDGEDIVEHWRISTDARRTADELAVLMQGLMGMHPLLGDELGGEPGVPGPRDSVGSGQAGRPWHGA